MDRVGYGCDKLMQKGRCDPLNCLFVQLNESELARPIDAYEQVELALFRADLRDVDVEVADRVGFELRALRLGVRP